MRLTPGYVYEGLSRDLAKVRVIVGVGWRSSINMSIFILWNEGLGVLKGPNHFKWEKEAAQTS